MSNFTLFEIKSQTLGLTAQIIEELLSKQQLRCGECRAFFDLSSGLLRISPKNHFQTRPLLLCIHCGSGNSQGYGVISFGFVYEVIKCFNAFNMKQLTRTIASKILDEINIKNNLRPHEKTEILKTLSSQFGHYSSNPNMTSNMSLEVKTNIILQCMNEVVKKIIDKEVFSYCVESSSVHKLSQEKSVHLIRLLRNQIEIKLEALKHLRHIIRDHSQLKTILQFSVAALKLLHQPLESFYKTNQSNHVLYSLARRQIKLKPREEYSMIQEGEEEMEQLVRLNQPLQSKPVVFKLKCPFGSEKVRLGFFFMTLQDYKAEAEYEKPFQPLQIVFNVSSEDNLIQQQQQNHRGENEITRPNIMMINPQTQRRNIMSLSSSQFNSQQKKFAMSYKKDVKNLQKKEFDVLDETLIELKYQKCSKTVTIKNLSQGVQIYHKKFKTKLDIDLNKIVVFPCVVLTGANCTVEYILTE